MYPIQELPFWKAKRQEAIRREFEDELEGLDDRGLFEVLCMMKFMNFCKGLHKLSWLVVYGAVLLFALRVRLALEV